MGNIPTTQPRKYYAAANLPPPANIDEIIKGFEVQINLAELDGLYREGNYLSSMMGNHASSAFCGGPNGEYRAIVHGSGSRERGLGMAFLTLGSSDLFGYWRGSHIGGRISGVRLTGSEGEEFVVPASATAFVQLPLEIDTRGTYTVRLIPETRGTAQKSVHAETIH